MSSPITKWRFLSICSLKCEFMKKSFVMAILFLVAVITFSFTACAFDESERNFYGGELLNDDKLSEIKGSVFTDEAKTESVAESKGDETEINDKGTYTESDNADVEVPDTDTEALTEVEDVDEEKQIVYWTKNGSVWHIDEDCYRLNKSKEIISGTIDEAKESGKERVCSSCGK